jgi:tyrosinase
VNSSRRETIPQSFRLIAFDPIFFLHHCNVDRLLSIWSALHPGVEVDKEQNDQAGTFTMSPDTLVDENTGMSESWMFWIYI